MNDKDYIGFLKAFVNHPMQWDAYTRYIADEIDSLNRKLQQSDNMTDIARAQGAIHQLQRMLKLKDLCNVERK